MQIAFLIGTKKNPPANGRGKVFIQWIENCSGNFHIHRIHSFFAAFGVERNLVAFPDIVDKTGDVYENFFFRVVVYNKPETFRVIEEFDCTLIH